MISKSVLLFIAEVILCISVCTAQERKEAYRKLRKSSQSSSEELLKQADKIKEEDPGEALNKVEEALGASLAREDALNEGRSYLLLGEINENILEWKLALENYARAYEKLAAHTSSPEFLRTLRGLGKASLKLGNYNESLGYFREALALKLEPSDKDLILLDLSEVHYQMGNYDEALKVLAAASPRQTTDPSVSSRIQNQQAKTYAKTNDLDRTRDLYQNSLNALRSGKSDPKGEAALQEAKEEIAGVLRDQNRYEEEIALRNQSIEFNLDNNNLAEVTRDKVAISKTLEAKGENMAALREMEEAARFAEKLDDPRQQASAFLALAKLCEKNGRNGEALNAYRKYSNAMTRTEALDKTALIEKSDLIKRQQDIEELTNEVFLGQREVTIEEATLFRQQLIIYGLTLIIVIIGITSFFIYRNAQASKRANQLLALKSLRSQMNPHFIFNALNSVNHFIAEQDERSANKFLSEFSQLMRLVLENSQEDFIPLQKEQEILALYLKLEHYRFRDKFDYEIDLGGDMNAESIQVPPMLIQPYIENAVWHGLRYRESKGKLSLRFNLQQDRLLVEISDDGIGRRRSAELKTENQKKHNSTGLKNIWERVSIINKVYKAGYQVVIEDLAEGSGTRVLISLPIKSMDA